MEILDWKVLRGPNVYHSEPVIVARLDLQEKAELGSHEAREFSERLVRFLPGLNEHHCSPGYRGGFIERLKRGTYFGHIVEHVALELSVLAGLEVSYGKTVYGGTPGQYLVVVRFKNEEAMIRLLKGAVELVNALYLGETFELSGSLSAILREARQLALETSLGPSTQALVDAAIKRGIPWRRIGEGSLIEFGYGRRRRRLQAAVTDATSLIAADLVQDKHLTKTVLKEAAIPVPKGGVFQSVEEALPLFSEMRKPVAVKPLGGHHGIGISLNVSTPEELVAAFALAKTCDSRIIVEEMCAGRDYRVLVVKNKVVAVAERIPAHVKGDGVQTVEALIAIENVDPRRGDGHQNVLTKIVVDEAMLRCLSRQNLSLQSIPENGQTVFLRETANLSTGGTAKDVTDLIHPAIRSMCERAARICGLDICGLDLIHSDISRGPGEQTAIIEVNAGPGLRMHVAPTEGTARDIGGLILDSVYPKPRAARIPIAAITGTNGKTTTARLLARILSSAGAGTIGMTTSDGIYIGDTLIESGDTTGPISTRVVLSDPAVDAAVLEVARGGVLRGGLGYDWSDVGIVTNIRPDHIGQDGIETIEDIVRIKSLIPERVRAGGTIVLNADDQEASRLMQIPRLQKIKRNIVYYSLSEENPVLMAHRSLGGRAYFLGDGALNEARGMDSRPIVPVRELSVTMGGAASFQVSNALAACAAARAIGLTVEEVASGLRSFVNARDNLGRMNVYRVGQGYVVLDYAHNADAIQAVASFLKGTGRPLTAVIGLPGDRTDALIEEAARVAAHGFDRLIVREDLDRRGRKAGEVPKIIERIARAEQKKIPVETILDSGQALKHAVETLGKDEVAIYFYEDYESAFAFLRDYDPAPVEAVDEFVASVPDEELPLAGIFRAERVQRRVQ